MSSILAVDTSTSRGSVAVVNAEEVLFEEHFLTERGHSSVLFPLLKRALDAGGTISQIVVGLGPGSYAGIRIGISAVMGIGWGRNIPIVGYPSISVFDCAEPYIAIGDARRGSFYFAKVNGMSCTDGPVLLHAEELKDRLEANPNLPVLASAPVPGFPSQPAFPEARKLAAVPNLELPVIAELEPLYLREAHITYPKQH